MSLFDAEFAQTCNYILNAGYSDEGLPVRAHWPDGTPAHTKMIFNYGTWYSLRTFDERPCTPVLTIRKTNFKACVDEILWIYQKHSNNVKKLNSHIWDSWADETGSIGKAYGYQIGKLYRHHKYVIGEDLDDYPSAYVTSSVTEALEAGLDPEYCDDTDWVWMNQIDGAIWSLRNNPTDRGIIINMYNHHDLADMHLRPCAYSLTFNVQHRSGERPILHALLNQRSNDMVTANGWNVTQYSVLVHMVAQVCGMEAGSLTHMVANAHIYDRHIPIAQELIRRVEDMKAHPSPDLWINPGIGSFKDFTVDDIELVGYRWCDEPLPKIEVAI